MTNRKFWVIVVVLSLIAAAIAEQIIRARVLPQVENNTRINFEEEHQIDTLHSEIKDTL